MRKSLVINKRTILGALPLTAAMMLYVGANKLTTAANAIMLQYTSPVFTLIISAIFTHTRIKKRDIAVMLMAMAGIGLFFVEKVSLGGMAGNILALLSGVSFAFMYYFSSTYGEEAMHALILGNILCFIIGFPFVFTQHTQFTLISSLTLVGMGILQLGVPGILFSSLMKHTTPFKGVIITMVEPLLNPVWVFIGVGEVPGMLAIVGGLIVIAAIVVNIWQGRSLRQASVSGLATMNIDNKNY